MTTSIVQFDEEWFELPLAIRQRWWDETNFGKRPPSEELVKAVQAALILLRTARPSETPVLRSDDTASSSVALVMAASTLVEQVSGNLSPAPDCSSPAAPSVDAACAGGGE